ncbi:WS/DGAT/MGAT family O-acyltransferase [Mycobacterium lacus]|uniref:Diacylglycerol O-acyltransferase n=1 Tax=Mycobacterium lacus TaxID=169765 RepID=A0A1X1YQM2_9MYCO|nr:wax ester/triacylglycerol synthase family O-acyltransferase [Mycobacterium lacus]MCV7122088.1 wax ester/triacylglycerol synthase family O-acyltransferase [Mycobacterium lacus]ORW13374.1 diacylglycerol O-acyltransferase [Mycobacterium lacus]BBX97582.1 putative diacyglycerol O-acyltransferase [Mycobacterium lacus]
MKWLNGTDALMLSSETPNVHLHTLKVAVIELDQDCRNFDIEAFRAAIGARLHKLEPFCYQLVEVPFKFHHPMWREHCDVELTYHIRPWRLPAPGGRRELDEAIGQIGSAPLDRSRPLWELYFVEGLSGGRIAVVGKIHHALVDGVGAANLMALGMDLRPGPQRGPQPPDPVPSTRRLIGWALADHVRHGGRIPRAIGYTARGLSRVRRSSRTLSEVLRRPFTPPPTFMNHHLRSPKRRFASISLALADVKQTGQRLGVTVNDLVLAMSTGALRTLLLRYDGRAEPLSAVIPVSLDGSADRFSGNCADALSVALPVDLEHALERVRGCRRSAMSSKERQRLRGPELASRWLDCAPPVIAEPVIRLASSRKAVSTMPNLIISNVRGPFERRGRVGGALVTEIYSVGHLAPWSGLNITAWSYVDQLNVSVLTDDATVEDPHEVTEAMRAEFVEIRRSAGLSEQLTVVECAMAPIAVDRDVTP